MVLITLDNWQKEKRMDCGEINWSDAKGTHLGKKPNDLKELLKESWNNSLKHWETQSGNI